MQNYYKTIGAMLAASALVAGNASAEVEYEIHTGYTSEYLFRGIDLGNDLVETGVDVTTEFSGLSLSAGAWYGSFDASGPGVNDGDELDLYGEVAKDFGFITGAVGYIWYDNIRSLGSNAQEVYFSIGKEFFGVDFSLTYFWDIQGDNDGYTELAASKGFELSPCLTLNTSLAYGYLMEHTESAHLTAKVALDWEFTETATLSPFIAHSWGLGNDSDNVDYNNELVAGTMLSVSF